MCALRRFGIAVILGCCAVTGGALGKMPRKAVDVPDADLRLMAMLYVSIVTPR